MRISDYLREEFLCTEMKSAEKSEAIKEVAALLKDSSGIVDFEKFVKDVFDREKLETTGIGSNIAIPHARTDAVGEFIIAFGKADKGIDFGSVDDQPVKLIFLMGIPLDGINTYLQKLAHLTRILHDEIFRSNLLEAKDAKEIVRIFQNKER